MINNLRGNDASKIPPKMLRFFRQAGQRVSEGTACTHKNSIPVRSPNSQQNTKPLENCKAALWAPDPGSDRLNF